MDRSSEVKCQRCGHCAALLNTYSACGHRTCDECYEVEETSTEYNDTSGCSSSNVSCPICQRHALFQNTRQDEPFPPYFRRFDIIRSVQVKQAPVLCEECGGERLCAGGTSRCLDCGVYLCDLCTNNHIQKDDRRHRIFTLKELRDGNMFDEFRLIPRDDPTLCYKHPGTRFSHWCNHCECPVCRQCLRHHDGHTVTPLTEKLIEMQSQVTYLKETVEKFLNDFENLTQKHERKKKMVQDHFEYLTASIKTAAEERKHKIDNDTDKLLEQVDKIKEDYDLKCKMLEEMIETQDVATHAWNKVLGCVFKDGDDLADDKLIDCFHFLKGNETLITEQLETVKEISEAAPRLSEIRHCVFTENMNTFRLANENSVGTIDTPILMLVGELADEGGVWVILGDRGHHMGHHRRNQKSIVIPHFLTLNSKECSLYRQERVRKYSFNPFNTVTGVNGII